VERIISACKILAKEQCIQRHDTVCAELHCNICKEIGGELYSKHRYGHLPKFVHIGRKPKVTVLWIQQCKPTEFFPNNKPDIIICDNKQGTWMSKDAANSCKQKYDKERS